MFKSSMRTLFKFSFAAMLFSSTASASLILEQYDSGTPTPETIGSYTMTDFTIVNSSQIGDKTYTTKSPFGDDLIFLDENGVILDMTRGLANSTGWWNNGENSDYDVFTTDVNWMTILLPANTRAFSFNVGANSDVGGWLMATENDDIGIMPYTFDVNPNSTPGFGIYTSNDAGQCSTLTSVTIEPFEWGVGNFSINNDPCMTVPEPPTSALLGLGIIGLLLSWRKSMSNTAHNL
jgi:hypothetical protein